MFTDALGKMGVVDVSGSWVSWDEAARLAGVRVPTVEHAVRVGRIAGRPAQGSRPSLDRESVLQWASWYREVQAGRDERRAARERAKGTRPRARGLGLPTGAVDPTARADGEASWIPVTTAAATLACSDSSVLRWAREGGLEGRFDGQAWVTAESVQRLAAARAADGEAWVSQEAAAAIVRCSHARVPELVAEGLLVQRPGPRWRASISRESAVQAAAVWAARLKTDQDAREERRRARPTNGPPEDGDVWVTTATAALALGLTSGGVGARIRAGTLPGTLRGNRYWLRRADVEVAAAAQAFAIRQEVAGSLSARTRRAG